MDIKHRPSNIEHRKMKLPVYSRAGAETGRTVELDEAVFGVEPNDHVIWLDVRSIQAAARQGTHKTKERAEVSYSTRKLFRQKGTGGARRGSRKSPLLRKGGTIFGPKPHEYNVRVNRKTKQLARRSAIAYKLRDDAFRIVEDLQFDAPKTKDMVAFIQGNGLAERKVLLLTAAHDETIYRSGRNLPRVEVLPATNASTLDLLGAQTILIAEGALEALTTALRPSEKPDVTEIVETGTPVEAPAPKAPRPKKAKPAPAAEVETETETVAEQEAPTEAAPVEAPARAKKRKAAPPDEAAPVAEAAPEEAPENETEAPATDDPETNDEAA
jgi:large subunit ribosomal protein L4